LALSALCLTACGGSGSENGGATSAGPAKDELTVLQSFSFTNMNPLIDPARPSTRISGMAIETAAKYVFEGGQAVLKPWLCTGWEQIEPNRWRFQVRPDVTFSNGEPLNAEAFKFSLETTLAAERSGGAVVFRGAAIEVVDELTFDVVTAEPNGIVPQQMSYFFVLPPAYYASAGEEKFGEAPIGTGPYTITAVDPGVSVALARSDTYWGEAPQVAKITVRVVQDASTRVAELERGTADIVEAVPPLLRDRVSALSGAEIRETPTNVRMMLVFNSHLGNTEDVKVRRAVSAAINREAIAEGIFKESAAALNGIFVPGEIGHVASTPIHNPELARQLVAELGGSLAVDLYATAGALPMDEQIIQAVQAQLAEVGIEATITTGTAQAILRPFYAGQNAGAVLTQLGLFYPDSSLIFGNYFTSYAAAGAPSSNDEMERLADEAFKSGDDAVRQAKYEEAQRIAIDEALWSPIVALTDSWGVAKDLKWTPRPDQQYDLATASW
jgi:peptide/nickel transport system substrate-binding protein